MNVATLPRTILRAEYAVVRRSLKAVHDRVFTFFPDDTARRLRLEQVQGQVDIFAGRVLGDAGITARGERTTSRVAAATDAENLRAAASRERQQADRELVDSQESAVAERRSALEERNHDVDAARKQAADQKSEASAAAAGRAKTAKAEASDDAARHVAAAEETQRVHDASVNQHTEAALVAPKQDLADARAAGQAAVAEHEKADRLAELTTVEQENRAGPAEALRESATRESPISADRQRSGRSRWMASTAMSSS